MIVIFTVMSHFTDGINTHKKVKKLASTVEEEGERE